MKTNLTFNDYQGSYNIYGLLWALFLIFAILKLKLRKKELLSEMDYIGY
jgi:hypothetical protein